jgi:hypothetical protein
MTTTQSRALTARHLRAAVWVLLLTLWAPVALAVGALATPAAPVVAVALEVSPLLLLISAALSTLSGATALLLRIDRELTAAPDRPLPRPWLFCSAHMLGSWLAGVMAFIGSQRADLSGWEVLFAVLVASFVGARAIEMVAERWLARFSPPPPPAGPQGGAA